MAGGGAPRGRLRKRRNLHNGPIDEVVEQTESLGNFSKEILISDKKLAKICKTNLTEITTEFEVDEVVEQTESLGNFSKEILISDKKLAKICKTNLTEITTEFEVDEVVEQTESLGNFSKEILISDKKLAKICKTNLTLHPSEHADKQQTSRITLQLKFLHQDKFHYLSTVPNSEKQQTKNTVHLQ
ncbi:Uncharacterized protein Fot_21884 [Forsythia ovata]|uniref:Uncharacterized protein n=1 Tax=Forsythia ovata TaxID=205694 RepID=A0ABD1UX58_9LAMI